MNRLPRILWVSLGLVVASAVCGGIAGGVALASVVALIDGPGVAVDPAVLLFGAAVGAPLGVLTGPAAAWLLLRHVPFGRLFTGAIVGTVVGAVAGWFVAFPGDVIDQAATAMVSSFAGFLAAVVLMSVKTKALRT